MEETPDGHKEDDFTFEWSKDYLCVSFDDGYGRGHCFLTTKELKEILADGPGD